MANRSDPQTPNDRPASAPNRAFLWLTVRFLGYLFIASLAFSLGNLHRHLFFLQSAIASASGWLAGWLGTPVNVNGSVLAVNNQSALDVNHECTGIFVVIIYVAFLLAYPARWLDRLWGIVAGIAIIQALNILRLAVLAAIAARWPDLFQYFHEYLWQGIFVAMLALLVASWIENLNRQALVPR